MSSRFKKMKTRLPTEPVKLKKLKKILSSIAHETNDKPLHVLLSSAISQSINQGEWKVGDRIPTEAELIQLSGYSLGTVQKALSSLAGDGTLSRKQGSGSFVNAKSQRIIDVAHARFLSDKKDEVLTLYSHILSRSVMRVHGNWSDHFSGKEMLITRIDRLLTVNNEFNVFNRFYFDARRFKRLASINLKELDGVNFKTLLEKESVITWGDELITIQVIESPSSVSRAMKFPSVQNLALLEISRKDRELSHTIYFQEFYIPPSLRKLQLTRSTSEKNSA
jgi:DNA-binding GntR family transcriptional regulator